MNAVFMLPTSCNQLAHTSGEHQTSQAGRTLQHAASSAFPLVLFTCIWRKCFPLGRWLQRSCFRTCWWKPNCLRILIGVVLCRWNCFNNDSTFVSLPCLSMCYGSFTVCSQSCLHTCKAIFRLYVHSCMARGEQHWIRLIGRRGMCWRKKPSFLTLLVNICSAQSFTKQRYNDA